MRLTKEERREIIIGRIERELRKMELSEEEITVVRRRLELALGVMPGPISESPTT